MNKKKDTKKKGNPILEKTLPETPHSSKKENGSWAVSILPHPTNQDTLMHVTQDLNTSHALTFSRVLSIPWIFDEPNGMRREEAKVRKKGGE